MTDEFGSAKDVCMFLAATADDIPAGNESVEWYGICGACWTLRYVLNDDQGDESMTKLEKSDLENWL